MKKPLTTLFLSFIANFSFLSAQEAWLLEMPNKYSDYLIKKSLAEDHDTVASIIEKLPDLITSKQAREIDLLTWKAVDGKIHKNKKITEGTATITAGVRYYSLSAGSTDHRKISIIPPVSTQRTFKIETFGRLKLTPPPSHWATKLRSKFNPATPRISFLGIPPTHSTQNNSSIIHGVPLPQILASNSAPTSSSTSIKKPIVSFELSNTNSIQNRKTLNPSSSTTTKRDSRGTPSPLAPSKKRSSRSKINPSPSVKKPALGLSPSPMESPQKKNRKEF